MYRNVECNSALSLPGNYKAHVRKYHGNERSNNRIFPPLKNNSLPNIEEYCSTADSTDLQWPLNLDEGLVNKEQERDNYGVDMLGVNYSIINISLVILSPGVM